MIEKLRDSVLSFIERRIDFCWQLAHKLDALNKEAIAENRITKRNRTAARGLRKTIGLVQNDIAEAQAFANALRD